LKKTGFFFFVFIFSVQQLFSQYNLQLCKSNETVAFAFQLNNKKWVSVCREKNDKYLVYRFGTKDKIELIFPAALDSTSWQQFTFKYYNRGGGKQNAAMNIAFLSFNNNEAAYEVYEVWNSEDNKKKCGVSVTAKGKDVDMKGILTTTKNYLQSLSESPVKLEEEQ
jgi:hypothetical protein